MSNKPVTLITGTRKGIGRYLVEYFVQKGHHVVGCSRTTPDWELPGYEHFLADVYDEETVKQIFSHIKKTYGRLDHLINNAGISSMNHSLLTPMSTVQRVLETNVAGTFLFCREAAKVMKKAQYGRIVNLSTIAIPLKLEGESIYAASKSAVITLTEVLAREFAPFGITVNCMGPAPVDTDLVRGVPKEKIDEILKRQAIPRFGTVEEVAHVVDFYLSEKSGFITGQSLFHGGL